MLFNCGATYLINSTMVIDLRTLFYLDIMLLSIFLLTSISSILPENTKNNTQIDVINNKKYHSEPISIELLKYKNKIILTCASDIFKQYPFASVRWYTNDDETFQTLIKPSKHIRFIKNKMVLSDDSDNLTKSYSCSVKTSLKEIFSQQLKVNLYLDLNNLTKLGECIEYPPDGACHEIKNFPTRVFIQEASDFMKIEENLKIIKNEYENSSVKINIFSDHLVPFICYSEYLFCKEGINITFRIHHEDLLNMLSSLKNSPFPMDDDMIRKVTDIYRKNKEDIKLKTESKQYIRYSVKTITGDELESCLNGNGKDYMGTVNISYSKRPCLKWSSIPLSVLLFPMPFKDMDNNYCRNPSGHERAPYCYISDKSIELCNIPKCTTLRWILSHLNGAKKYVPYFLLVCSMQLVIGTIYAIYRYNYIILRKYNDYKRTKYLKRFKKISKLTNWDSNIIFTAKNAEILNDHHRNDSILISRGYFKESANVDKTLKKSNSSIITRKKNSIGGHSNSYTFTLPMILNMFFEFNRSKFSVFDHPIIQKKIPYVYSENVELTPMIPGSKNLYYAKISSKFIKGFIKQTNPTVTVKLQRMCIVKSCEDSWRNVERRLCDTQHFSISKFIGVMINKESCNDLPTGLLFEPCLSPDLPEFFKNEHLLGWPKKIDHFIQILFQISHAIDYLHKKCIVHGDVSLRNCGTFPSPFVTKWPIIKLTDYAKFKETYKEDYIYLDSTQMLEVNEIPRKGLYLPVKWMAPELVQTIFSVKDCEKIRICSTHNIKTETLSKVPGTFESDIYSLGVTIWELFNSAEKPFGTHTNEGFVKMILADQIPALNLEVNADPVFNLIRMCTASSPLERPAITFICQQIKDARDTLRKSQHNRATSY